MDRIRQDPMISITEAARGKATDSFLSAIDWALRVEEADRPQGIRVWRSALLGEEAIPERQQQAQPHRHNRHRHRTRRRRQPQGGYSQQAFSCSLVQLPGGACRHIRNCSGKGTGETPTVTEQEVPTEAPAETSQETETQQIEERWRVRKKPRHRT